MTLILTPNRRLAAFSQRIYNQQQQALGLKCWPSLEILPYTVWFGQLWQAGLDLNLGVYRPMLSGVQQQILLEQIIQKSKLGTELLRLSSTAHAVLEAYRFLRQWQISLERVAAYADVSEDVAAFCSWIGEYQAWLQQYGYIDADGMHDMLLGCLDQLQPVLPRTICLRGMHDLSPQHAQIIAQLAQLGVEIITDHLLKPSSVVARMAYKDAEQEWHAAAAWAAELIQQDTAQIIGIVVPTLGQVRKKVSNIFSHYLAPEVLNMSAPLKLSAYSLISSALLLLQLAKPRIGFANFSVLLRCSYIKGGYSQASVRAVVDVALRKRVSASVTWEQLASLQSGLDVEFAALLVQMVRLVEELDGQHGTLHWVGVVEQIVQMWGWPGDAVLDEQQQDLLACWRELLGQYAKLELIVPPHTFAQAVQLLVRLAAETDFLPAETGETKIHVLGILEADGLLFDQLWVTGMSQDAWPMETDPNPYIPIELQRQFDLPKSSPQRELKIARRLTGNLQQGATQRVIFSYPRLVEYTPTRVSTLLEHVPEIPVFAVAKVGLDDAFVTQEYFNDDLLGPFTASTLPGGTKLLELQRKCPFKAAAQLRLKANVLDVPQFALNAAQRGVIMHEVLEHLWRRLGTRQELLRLWPEQIMAILQQIVVDVLHKANQDCVDVLSAEYMEVERIRVLRILRQWLALELQRDEFNVVAIEQEVVLELCGYKLKIRIDRVDRLGSGGLVIIDYKTGLVNNSEWLQAPITAPQLPLYALAYLEQVVGLAYADLSADGIKFIGAGLEEGVVPGVKEFTCSWEEQYQLWQDDLTATLQSFVQGEAYVRPLKAEICQQCELQMLCRIYERR